eukprot:184951_1
MFWMELARNHYGQLGYGDTNHRGDEANEMSDNLLDGQLGYGDTNVRGDGANEMGDNLLGIDLGTNFIPMQIVTGYDHTCALSTANKVKCFGRNHYGQLGYGDTNNRGDEANEMGDNLSEIDLGTNFISMQIVAGMHHTCALSTAYKVKCWGYNSNGQLGYGDTNNRVDEANQMGDTLLEIDLGSDFTVISTGIPTSSPTNVPTSVPTVDPTV